MPRRILVVLEGEGLVNDAAALVIDRWFPRWTVDGAPRDALLRALRGAGPPG